MSTLLRLLGVLLIAAGAYGLYAKEFSYTKKTHAAKLGGLELSIDEKETLAIPVWLGGGALALGIGLLLVGGRRA